MTKPAGGDNFQTLRRASNVFSMLRGNAHE